MKITDQAYWLKPAGQDFPICMYVHCYRTWLALCERENLRSPRISTFKAHLKYAETA